MPGGLSPALGLGLLASAIVHLFLLLTLTFALPEPVEPIPKDVLEVLILKDGGVAPATPDPDAALSQRARAGESPRGDGTTSSRAGLDAPPEAVAEETEALTEALPADGAPPPLEQIPAEIPEGAPPAPMDDRRVLAAELLHQADPEPVPPPKPKPTPAPDPMAAKPRPPADARQILASRNSEIARLTASLEARAAAYASRPRRKSVSASTREYRYASYIGAWARKVERIGNLNFPQAAKDQRLQGSLMLNVAVRIDGSVESVRVMRSSGYDLLDQAAIRIVELAGPYSPLTPDIAAETDVLHIFSTWKFERGGRFGWE